MEKPFKINILTQERSVYSGQAVSLIVPAAFGYLGVLANHAPLIANLIPGKITLRDGSGKSSLFYSQGKGFLEVLHNQVTILLDAVAAV